MQRRRLMIGSVALLFGLVAGAAVLAQEFTTGHALQHPSNQSGVMGRITFTETPAGLIVEGTATGLEGPSVGRYVSLVYDVGSVPGGPTGCEPTVELANMFVGIWVVDADGNGELVQLNPAVAPLDMIDTVSIRDGTVNQGFGPEAVVACGQIAVRGGRR
jgi:hypothetical protein